LGKKVIMIDDSRTARRLVCLALGDVGIDVIEAVDGFDGISKLAAHADAAVVLCDLNMPRMGGLEMLAAVRNSDLVKDRIIMMLSTFTERRQELHARRMGASGWLTKPFEPAQLVATVERLLDQHAQGPES
jgi:two-component system, chemotaxis family, chemotaxis protein CheY